MSNIFIDQPLKGFVWESNRIEGINRDPTVREIEAHRYILSLSKITVGALEEFVSIIQPRAILRNHAGLNVRVGNHYPPLGGPDIEKQLEVLLCNASATNSYNTHIAYEQLHPFTDGNGRSGRALWLWQIGSKAPLGFLHTFYYQTLQAKQ